MNKIKAINHPLLNDKLSRLRSNCTTSQEFRSLIKEIASFLCYEACRHLPVETVSIDTPMGSCEGEKISSSPTIISIMRAGNGMADAINTVIPQAHTGHIGVYRDKFINNTVEYYFKMPPNTKNGHVFLVDPLLATGDTAVACIDRLKEFEAKKITFLTILASKAGLQKVIEKHPETEIFLVDIEDTLDDNGYLVPGLGDVGDRFYNTK